MVVALRLANINEAEWAQPDAGQYQARGRALTTRQQSPVSRSGLTPPPPPSLPPSPPRSSWAQPYSSSSAEEEVVVWSGRVARLRRPFYPREGAAAPDFALARSPRAVQTASRLGVPADPAQARADRLTPRPSLQAQRAADAARHQSSGAGTNRCRSLAAATNARAPSTLDAPWLAPEQRDVLTVLDQRVRETQRLVRRGAAHTGRLTADATQSRAWHNPACGLGMALPKLRALSANVTVDDIVVAQMARARAAASARPAVATARSAAAGSYYGYG